MSTEGFRLLWFHSTRKVARDVASRVRAIERTQQELAKLRERLQLPRTRFRDQQKVRKAVDEILDKRGTAAWVQVEILQQQEETFKQAQRGRPGTNTQYVRQLSTRYRLSISIDLSPIDLNRPIAYRSQSTRSNWSRTSKPMACFL